MNKSCDFWSVVRVWLHYWYHGRAASLLLNCARDVFAQLTRSLQSSLEKSNCIRFFHKITGCLASSDAGKADHARCAKKRPRAHVREKDGIR